MLPLRFTRLLQGSFVALAIALSACGGGGGGGASTPPVSNPGGNSGGTPSSSAPSSVPSGSPSGAPSGSPGHTPTPAPSASPGHTPAPGPSQSPTPTPTQTPVQAQSITILPDTTGRFSLMQVGDTNAAHTPGNGMTAAQVQQEAPFFDAVWAAFLPSTWNGAHPGMYVSRYVLPNEDIALLSGHNLPWFQANEPDWILYACQPDGTPTHELAFFGTNFGDVPLDIHNPAVVAYQMNLLGPDMANEGYNSLAADNVEFINYSEGPNPNFGEGNPQAGWYGCGIWEGNTFVRRYNGGRLAADPTWIADMQNWIATAKAYLAARNYKLLVNHPPYGFPPNAAEQQMLQNIDGMLDENGFTYYGRLTTGNAFMNTLNWMQYTQSRNVAFWLTDYFCYGSSCSKDISTLSPSQVDWSLATYALGNNGGAGVYISPATGGTYGYRSEFSQRYGTPCSAFQTSGTLVFRKFSNGFAVANSGTGAQSITLPAHNYTDIEGRAISNPLMVNGTDAYMLLLPGGGGCS